MNNKWCHDQIERYLKEVLTYKKSIASLDEDSIPMAKEAIEVMDFHVKKMKILHDSGDIQSAALIASSQLEKIDYAKEMTEKWKY